ncbi:MAG: signal peptidase I [bacterium]
MLNSIKPIRLLRYAHTLLGRIAVLLVVLILANAFVITIFRVDGHSMQPTLQNGQPLAVCEACLWFRTPQKDDVVIVQYEGAQSVRFVKRVEGLPGETVLVQNQPVVLQENQYFVEGDNRGGSTDSRVYGPILKSQIIGRVLGNYPLPEVDK